jgi:hypothetical protein
MFGYFYTPDTPEFLKAWHRRRVLATPDHVMAGCLLGMCEGDEGIARAVIAQDYLRQRTAPRLAVYAAEPATWLERTLPAANRMKFTSRPGAISCTSSCRASSTRWRWAGWTSGFRDACQKPPKTWKARTAGPASHHRRWSSG